MSEPAALLIVDEVSRRYEDGGILALDRVSFRTGGARTLALTGPSGCGKSTLLSLIGLLDRPTAGRIVVAGEDLATIRRPGAFRAHMVGFVFQFHHMVPTMTLLENVAAPMIALGVGRAERQRRAGEMLEGMGLGARAHFLPANVSGGERQRAAVARALVNRPRLVLADEPTGNLDSRNGQLVVDLLVHHARSLDALVLIATHNPDVARAADSCLVMRDGRLRPAGAGPEHDAPGSTTSSPSVPLPSMAQRAGAGAS